MAPIKCCVIGCDSTSNSQRLFCMPMNDNLRNLWMSKLVPTNPYLLGLTKDQLMAKRVCQRHFDQTQFDQTGVRIGYSYPCLFTEKEFVHGVPLSSEGDVLLQEHSYMLPSTSQMAISTKSRDEGDALSREHHESFPTTCTVTPGLQNEGVSVARRPLTDISQKDNIETELFQVSHPSTSKEVSVSRKPLANILQNANVEAKLLQTKKQSTSKGISKINQFKSKTRQFVKETTKIAADSLGQTSMERLKNAQKYAGNQELIANFEKLGNKARAFLIMQLRLAALKKYRTHRLRQKGMKNNE